MKMNLIEERKNVNSLLADYRSARKLYRNKKRELADSKKSLKNIEKAYKITQQVAEQIQQSVHKQISAVVTRCLQTVFYDAKYSFKMNFVKSKNRTSVVLSLIKDGHEIVNPLNSDSGAVGEWAGEALRLCCLIMSKPQLRKLLVLDEPFKSLSAEYYDNTRKMIESLSKDFGIQIIMVTHNPKLQTGKVIEL